MKHVLITGENSYIGTSFDIYLQKFGKEYQVDTIDMVDGSWRNRSFAGYDAVFHVAGIAHKKETKENTDLYYKVNRDLAIETAQKAKLDGVRQFVFLSSMSVYGLDVGVITEETQPKPTSNYGKSKYEAEQGLVKLACDTFQVAVLRPPMVYGEGCKGNYQTIVKLVKKFPVFPYVKNRRSMIHIDVLTQFVKTVIDSQCGGLYFPQNEEYVQTCELAREIAAELNKKIYFSVVLGMCVLILKPFSRTVKKAFGSLVYAIK